MQKEDLRIYFTDFWSNFNPESNYFTKLLSLRYNITIDSATPDILFYSTYGSQYRTYKCKKVFYTKEPIQPYGDYSLAFSYNYQENENHLRLPYYSYIAFEEGSYPKIYPNQNKEKRLTFCSTIINNIDYSQSDKECFNLAKELGRYKRILNSGKYSRNTNYIDILYDNLDERVYQQKVLDKEKPKFKIIFEDKFEDGYTSNKIFDCMVNGAIPIYYGNTNISKDFNEDSFISINRYPSQANAIDYIKFLDKYQNRYSSFYQQPWLKNESHFYYFDTLHIQDKIVELINKKENYFVNQDIITYQLSNLGRKEIRSVKEYDNLLISPNDYFDDIYCMNRNSDPDIWINIKNTFIDKNIFTTRIEKLDTKNDLYDISKTYQKIFTNAKKRELDNFLVIDDSCTFINDFDKKFNDSVKNLPKLWDIWILGYETMEGTKDKILNTYFVKNNFISKISSIAFSVDFIKRIMADNIINIYDILKVYMNDPKTITILSKEKLFQ